MKKRILILSEFTYLNNFYKGTEIIYDIHLISELLTKKNEVFVIDAGIGNLQIIENWKNSYSEFTKVSRAFGDLFVNYKSKQYNQKFYKCNNFLKLIYFSLSRFKFVFKIYKEIKPDIVISYSIFRLGIFGLICAIFFRKKFYFRFIDMIAYFKDSRFSRISGFILEFIILNLSKKIFVISKDYDYYVKKRVLNKSKVSIVPFFCKSSYNKKAITRSDIENIRLVFVGVLYHYSGIFELINSYNQDICRNYSFIVNIFGDGPDFERCFQLAKTKDILDVFIFHGFCNFTDVQKNIQSSDFAINTMINFKEKSSIFNAKIVQYLAVNRNVISIDRGSLRIEFPEGESGVFYVEDHKHIFLKAIDLFKSQLHLNNNAPYSYYKARHSPEAVENILYGLI